MSVTESKTKTERKSSRKPTKTQETVLSALLAQTEEVSVPLASLIKSPLNVRTVPYSAESVSELAESIIRAAGSDERRELTHAVMRELDAPDNWTMNGEYGSEFGGFFPVQVRFTPAHERFHLALCSPGDVSQVWVLVLVNAGGEPFAVVQVQRRFAPEAVSHSLALAASLDTQGYSVNDIIHILMAEGGQA